MQVLRIRFLISVSAIALLSLASMPLSSLAYQSQRQNRENKTQQTPVKKGKKGVTASAKKPEPKKNAAATTTTTTTTTASVPKTLPVTPSVAPPPTQIQPIPVQPTVVPQPTDKIDVIEYRKSANTTVPVTAEAKPGGVHGISTRRIDVEIEPQRVIQIQKALKDRGFYSSEPSGIYDDETIESMKAFQVKERIDATGYPTAHALKRLGL